MDRVIPPGIDQPAFDRALKAFANIVGPEWTLSSDLDRRAYSDIYAPGPETQWAPAAAVAPANREQVQAIVKAANQFGTPLWPVSRGKNLGYGSAAPRLAGSVVLDLGRMNKIRQVDAELSYCVIEPGVSFFDLYEHIRRNNLPLWLSVPGNAWGSVMGNALDHGIGYTPYGLHAAKICGMEVVLPNGDHLRTGMGAMSDNHAAHCFPLSYGPSWDLAFTQSNFGIVTELGLWLMPAPESSLQMTIDLPEENDIGWLVDTLRELKLHGIIDQSIFVANWLSKLLFQGQRSDFWDKPGAIPDWRVKELMKEHKIGYWQLPLRLYGFKDVIEARAQVIRKAFKRRTDIPFVESWWHAGDPINPLDPTMGVPTSVPLQMANWTGGRGGHLGFSPVVPATSQHVMRQLELSRKLIAEYDVDFYASFTFGDRFVNNVNMLMYDRDDERQVSNMRKLFSALIEQTKAAGYGEYRTHLGWMDRVADTFDYNDHALDRWNTLIKDAVDPNGILAPGKQGIWPSKYAHLAENGSY